MRLARITIVSLALMTGFIYGQAVVGVGDNGGNQNLCYRFGPISEKCTFTVPERGGSATGTSFAAISPSSDRINAGVSVAVDNYSTVSTMGTYSQASWPDNFTVGNYPAGASLFAAGSTASSQTGQFNQISFSLTMQDYDNGACYIVAFGPGSCSATVPLQQGPHVTFSLNLSGSSSASCNTLGCVASSAFAGSAKVIALRVVDSSGNPVPGATITTSSGHNYPSHFASRLQLRVV
jgi:hypothetical protein